jgi:hypothetical protein
LTVGKFSEEVAPLTNALPEGSMLSPRPISPYSSLAPPRKVE